MKTSDFYYDLPKGLIAQTPIQPRDHSRLFLYDRADKKIVHKFFYDLPTVLNKGDVLVLNNTKVFPARLIGKKATGGKVEVFLLNELKTKVWQVLLGGKQRLGELVRFNKELFGEISKKNNDGTGEVKFNLGGLAFWRIVAKIGEVPTPPYIKKKSNLKEYQTVFAKIKGSVAAPTAGFHFTKDLLNKLIKQGVEIEYLTLHVGWGTFAPIKTEKIKEHKLHSEWAELARGAASRLNQAKGAGRRIIAVGTTSVRTLEAFSDSQGRLQPQARWVDEFIYPGYEFKFIDALITNFHLPESTLFMLLAAFLAQNKQPSDGVKIAQRLYWLAIRKKYRFYSFGDAMMII